MIMMRRRKRGRGEGPTQFVPGDLVRHRRYGYRGVVVAFDLACTAPDEWYRSNQTMPDKEQPWYHVLVDGSPESTYAAQENLLPDHDFEEIAHPLLARYFDGFEDGYYVRNDRPWGT